MEKSLKIILLALIIPLFFRAQDKRIDKVNPPFIIKGNVGIPRGISSQMFRTCFYGIYEASINPNIRLFDNFYFGIGYQNSHFKNNQFLQYKFFNASIPYNTRFVGHSAFVSFTYQKFFSEIGYVSYTLNSGMMLNRFTNVNADTTARNKPYGIQEFYTPYLQPEVSLNFKLEDHLSFSLLLNYTTLFYKFDPKAPRFNQFKEVYETKNKYFVSWFTIGLGFNVLLGKNK